MLLPLLSRSIARRPLSEALPTGANVVTTRYMACVVVLASEYIAADAAKHRRRESWRQHWSVSAVQQLFQQNNNSSSEQQPDSGVDFRQSRMSASASAAAHKFPSVRSCPTISSSSESSMSLLCQHHPPATVMSSSLSGVQSFIECIVYLIWSARTTSGCDKSDASQSVRHP